MSITSTLSSQLLMFQIVVEECRRDGITDPELIDKVWDEMKAESAPRSPGQMLNLIHASIQSALFI